jgi:RNA polymerase sigma factor (sigma-70 family)
LADEITQGVFIRLAQQAANFKAGSILIGWLLRTTRYAAIDAIRSEVRRQKRENTMSLPENVGAQPEDDPTEALWELVLPHLDAALEKLREADRNAILLRFFEERSLAEVGLVLGVAEDAARKRVDRALERLLGLLQQQGVATSSALLQPALLLHVAPSAADSLVRKTVAMATSSVHAPPTVDSVVRSIALRSLKKRLLVWLSAGAAVLAVTGITVRALQSRPPVFRPGTTGDYRIAGFPDPAPVNRFVAELQTELVADERLRLAAKMHYPLHVNTRQGSTLIGDPKDFAASYEALFPPERIALLLKSPRESLQVEARGVYIEAGVLWIAPDGDPTKPVPKVFTINLN